MAGRRILYTGALAGGLVFFWAYREWLSGLLLAFLLGLPWLSLLLSIPAVLLSRVELRCPDRLSRGQESQVRLSVSCPLPTPEFIGRLRLRTVYTGKTRKLPNGEMLPTDHCGVLELPGQRLWAVDYLGLFRLPLKKLPPRRIPVGPTPVAPEKVPDLSRFLCGAARPKSGGGYSENHELRLYRPGDSLRQIHWKLSAKTGKLNLREPTEITPGGALVTLALTGTPDVLDDKLGRLLWISGYLLEHAVPHHICCLTGSGMLHLAVANSRQLSEAMDAILEAGPAEPGRTPAYPRGLWRCHIGGDGHEV